MSNCEMTVQRNGCEVPNDGFYGLFYTTSLAIADLVF